MNPIEGFVYRLGDSTRCPARLTLTGDEVLIEWHTPDAVQPSTFVANHVRCAASDVRLSDALGSIPQYILAPQDVQFHANDAIALVALKSALPKQTQSTQARFSHALERHKAWIVAALVFTVVCCVALYQYALPPAVNAVAKRLPAEMYRVMGQQTMSLLEESILKPSKIDPARQHTISQKFNHFVTAHPSLFSKGAPNLVFREWAGIPNAVTLANGQIVITDELMNLLNDDQVYAVLLHELGHAHGLDVMRATVRASALSIAVGMYLGDASSLVDTMVATGTLALNMSYSRQMEIAADAFAARALLAEGKSVEPFIHAFEKLESTHAPDKQPKSESNAASTEKDTWSQRASQISDWFASHPDTQERISRVRTLAAQR